MKKTIKLFSFLWYKFREYCDPAFEENKTTIPIKHSYRPYRSRLFYRSN